MSDIVIVDAARTPIGGLCGVFSTVPAHSLGSAVIKELVKRTGLDSKDISQVILGQALTAGQGQNPGRQASINGGLSVEVPAYTVSFLCGSGLKGVVLGCQAIKAQDADVVICGGQENMSLAPHCFHLRAGHKFGTAEFKDTMLLDGLTDAFHNIHMGITAENVAEKFNISREDQDKFALNSYQKVLAATKCGYFDKEIIPVTIKSGKTTVTVTKDDTTNLDTTLEKLGKLRTVFKDNGTVTAGNASSISDGAAAVVLTTSAFAAKKGLTPRAKVVAYAEAGCDPQFMGLGPIGAVRSVLKKAGWSVDDVDLFELNEAYAAQAIAVERELKVDPSKANINGGAIALGHPIGASGARILVTLLYSLERTNKKKGVAALCIGGGMGIAMAIERN